jgi:hypothetical protein
MIDEITEEAVNEAKLTEERVKKEIAKVAFSKVQVIDSSAKMKGLDLATKVLGMQVQKVEQTNIFDSLSFKAKMSRNIAKLVSKSGDDPLEIEREYQLSYADKSDEDYSADLDASVHPEAWPSGSLLDKPNTNSELAPQESNLAQ